MNQKKYIIIGLIIVLAIVTFFIIQKYFLIPKKDFELQEVIIINRPGRMVSLPLFIAQEEGFFEDNNIRVSTFFIPDDEAVNQLLSGEVDYLYSSPDALKASLAGAPIKQVAIFSDDGFLALFANNELENDKNIASIGIGRFYSLIHYHALRFIHDRNIDAKIISIQETPMSSREILIQGIADTTITSFPGIGLTTDDGFKVVDRIEHRIISAGLVVNQNKINNNPEQIMSVIKSIQSAIDFIENNPERTMELISQYLSTYGLVIEDEMLEDVYLMVRNSFYKEGRPNDNEGIENYIKFIKSGNFQNFEDIMQENVTSSDLDNIFDFRFIE